MKIGWLCCACAVLASPFAWADGRAIDTYAGRPPGDGWPARMGALSYGEGVLVLRGVTTPPPRRVDPGDVLVGDDHNSGRTWRITAGGDGSVDGTDDELLMTFPDIFTRRNGIGHTADPAGNVYYVNGRSQLVLVPAASTSPVQRFNWSTNPAAPRPTAAGIVIGVAQFTARDLAFAAGALYVVDPTANQVLKIERRADGLRYVSVVAGTGAAGQADGALVEATFNQPSGLCATDAGDLYVSDSGNHAIRRVDLAAGTVSTFAVGLPVHPRDLACDGRFPAAGALFAASDLGEPGYILRIDATGASQIYIGNGTTQPDPTDGAPLLSVGVHQPTLDVDAAGDLYVRANFMLYKIYTSGPRAGTLRRVAGNSVGEGVAAGIGLITQPDTLCLDRQGDLFVSDSFGRSVRAVDHRTGLMSTVIGTIESYGIGGWRDGHPSQAMFNQLDGVGCGADGAIDIVEGRNALLRRALRASDGTFTALDARVVTVVGVAPSPPGPSTPTTVFGGSTDLIPDGTPAREARLSQAYTKFVVEDRRGAVYWSDSGQNAVYVVTPGDNGIVDGGPGETVFRVAGSGVYGAGPEAIAARDSALAFPSGLAFDAEGNLYIADEDSGRIRRVSPGPDGVVNGGPEEWITTVAGAAGPGMPTDPRRGEPPNPPDGRFVVGQYTGGTAAEARFFFPRGIAVAGGVLFIGDAGNHLVRRVDLTAPSTPVEIIAGTLLGAPPATDPLRGWGVRTHLVDGPFGSTIDDIGDGGAPTSASMLVPSGVAVDVAGNVYFSDADLKVVRQVSRAATSASAIAVLDGMATELTLPDPYAARHIVVPSLTLQPLDARTRRPLGPWVRRRGAWSGDGAVLRALFGLDLSVGGLVRERVQVDDGNWVTGAAPR